MKNTLTIQQVNQLYKDLPDTVKLDLGVIIQSAKEKHKGKVPVGLFWGFGLMERALFSEGDYW